MRAAINEIYIVQIAIEDMERIHHYQVEEVANVVNVSRSIIAM
jgi:hypothetical protein